MNIESAPSHGTVLRVLKDGIWDRCELLALPDGSQRVRKTTKGTGPWGVHTLRAEIQYLRALPPGVAGYFPTVLAAWGTNPADAIVGYEMPYFAGWRELGGLIREGSQFQRDADTIQDALADIVFKRLHRPEPSRPTFAAHIEQVLHDALAQLDRDPEFSPLIRAHEIMLNGRPATGPGRALQRLQAHGELMRILGHTPAVQLHGDLLHENILWNPNPPAGLSNLILLDPVSVAGVWQGPPLFDLVKCEGYATGELYALRTGRVLAGPDASAAGPRLAYQFRVRWEDPGLRPFRIVDWHSRFRASHVARHGAIDRGVCRILDAYFALVMALNTQGLLRWARALKATECLDQALSGS